MSAHHNCTMSANFVEFITSRAAGTRAVRQRSSVCEIQSMTVVTAVVSESCKISVENCNVNF